MTYLCSTCDVRWHVYMTNAGACPVCGGGTKRVQQPASPDVQDRYRAACELALSRDKHERFEAFYAEREATLNGLDALPVTTEARAA